MAVTPFTSQSGSTSRLQFTISSKSSRRPFRSRQALARGSSITALNTQRGFSVSTALATSAWTSTFRLHREAQGSGKGGTFWGWIPSPSTTTGSSTTHPAGRPGIQFWLATLSLLIDSHVSATFLVRTNADRVHERVYSRTKMWANYTKTRRTNDGS